MLELATRTESGVTVTLDWLNEYPDPGVCSLTVHDSDIDLTTTMLVLGVQAWDAFIHPGAYGALACRCHMCSPSLTDPATEER